MNTAAAVVGMALGLFWSAETASAADTEPFAIVELGGAGEWTRPGWASSFGPSLAVEFPAIKDWLEIEIGTSTLFRRGQTEWAADLLFKKPYTLSETVEFMFGVGPELSYTTREGSKVAAEVALDFMFWPWPERRFGWFLEPTYSYAFGKGHEQSLAVSVGLLVAIP